jgi:hypothetical protein
MLLKNIKIGMTVYSASGRAYVVEDIQRRERAAVVAKSKVSGKIGRFLPLSIQAKPPEKAQIASLELQALKRLVEFGGKDVRLDNLLMPALIFRELAEDGYLTIAYREIPPEGSVGFGSITSKGVEAVKASGKFSSLALAAAYAL